MIRIFKPFRLGYIDDGVGGAIEISRLYIALENDPTLLGRNGEDSTSCSLSYDRGISFSIANARRFGGNREPPIEL